MDSIALLLLFPVLEEIVFRGLLQGFLAKKWGGSRTFLGMGLPNCGTTFVFCLTHLLTRSPLVSAMVLIPSLALGAMRDRGFSITTLACIHMYWNAGTFLLIGHPGSG